MVLAALLRLSTLDLQSFWYDEAYVPVHTLHPSLAATLRSVEHRENTPPLWYVLIWAWSRIFGTGMLALRLPSALAGIATVPVAWGIGAAAGRPPGGGRHRGVRGDQPAVRVVLPGGTRVRPVRVDGGARDVVLAARRRRADAGQADGVRGERRGGAGDALLRCVPAGADVPVAVAPAAQLGSEWARRGRAASCESGPPAAGSRSASPTGAFVAAAAIGAVGLALIPLALTQGGHGTQWIGAWALASRLETIPQYYLTGYSGASLGHGLELLVALEIFAAIGYGLWRMLTPRESEAALLALGVAACGVLIPMAMAVGGADYLAPRNVVAAMIPLSAGIATIAAARRTGRTGLALVGLIALTFAALSIDVDLSPRLQRGDWRGLAQVIRRASGNRRAGGAAAITTVELGAAPLEYYLPPLRNLREGAAVRVSEIDETGYAPLRPGAGEPPAPDFHLVQHGNVHGMILYRFISPTPHTVGEAQLRKHVIAEGRPEVLVR